MVETPLEFQDFLIFQTCGSARWAARVEKVKKNQTESTTDTKHRVTPNANNGEYNERQSI
jgi:hypothetical protein